MINAEDWESREKERGLYFASHRDKVYQSFLSMRDAGEILLEGALLSAATGKGRHTHTALILHHQMKKMVAGERLSV